MSKASGNGDDREFLKADGYDDAILGVVWGQWNDERDRLAYDTEEILNILQKRDGMTHEEASEFFEFNIAGSYVGKQTPLFIDKSSLSILDALSG